MNTTIDGQLYDITRRIYYSNIVVDLLGSLTKSAYIKTQDKVWADVEIPVGATYRNQIPVGDVVCIQVNDNISDKLYNYEY